MASAGRAWASSSVGAVVLELVGAAPALGVGVVEGGEDPGAEPPQRARGRVAVEHPPAGRDQPGGVEAEAAEGGRRLPDEDGLRRARRAGDVPQPLDGVHRFGAYGARRLPSLPAMVERSDAVTDPGLDTVLTPLRGSGRGRPLREWLTNFHHCWVVLDPYTNESAWVLEAAGRVLSDYAAADVRVGFLVTADADGTSQFLGPWADRLLAFVDPDRAMVQALGLRQLPALVHLNISGAVEAVVEGWDPERWRDACSRTCRGSCPGPSRRCPSPATPPPSPARPPPADVQAEPHRSGTPQPGRWALVATRRLRQATLSWMSRSQVNRNVA